MPASYANHRSQLKAILLGWGMPEENAEITSEVLSWADLHGVDSHGISMIPGYDRLRRAGRAKMDAWPRVVRETPVSAVVDGGGGLGHVPAHFAMSAAIAKARASGMAAAVVHSSAHFGAAGFYSLMAAKEGLVGMACTSASGIQVAPTFGKQARLGTDPWSFAAPSADGVPFLLDMATTTVAAGRVRNKANEGLPTPDGWVLDAEGRPSNDPLVAKEKGGFLTSLGGSPENSSYKGYALAVMVNILASCLSGATLITDPMHTKKPVGMDIGHFFMAIDPSVFRESDDFQADVATFGQGPVVPGGSRPGVILPLTPGVVRHVRRQPATFGTLIDPARLLLLSSPRAGPLPEKKRRQAPCRMATAPRGDGKSIPPPAIEKCGKFKKITR